MGGCGHLIPLETKVNSFDVKISKLWSDLDARVSKQSDNINQLQDRSEMTDMELAKTQEEVSSLKAENKSLKESLTDIQAKINDEQFNYRWHSRICE